MRIQKMPSTTLESPFTQAEFTKFFKNLSSYRKDFESVAKAMNMDARLLYGKAAIESGGMQYIKRKGGSSSERSLDSGFPETDNYVGLMQVGKLPVKEALLYLSRVKSEGAYSKGRKLNAPDAMYKAVAPIVKKYLPALDFNKKGSVDYNTNAAFDMAAKHPEFNILMGAIIYWLLLADPRFIEKDSKGEYIRLDKVVAAYNTGAGYGEYSKSHSDTAALIKALPNFLSSGKTQETKGHILKLVGKNGAYDLLFNNRMVV